VNSFPGTEYWLEQLTEGKRTDLDQLSRRNRPLQDALDSLIPFIGQWEDFSLGVLHRLLTMKGSKVAAGILESTEYN
jgi:hypothetical protein